MLRVEVNLLKNINIYNTATGFHRVITTVLHTQECDHLLFFVTFYSLLLFFFFVTPQIEVRIILIHQSIVA